MVSTDRQNGSLTCHGRNTDVRVLNFLRVRQPKQVIEQRQEQKTEGEAGHPRFFFFLGEAAMKEVRNRRQDHAEDGDLCSVDKVLDYR